ncbi:hypothetical protein J437_LFUL000832 [Ladona fulva]|uniref:Uncharacterized protein n=1 Tax=Ladona fulva TaxID=123851 RepID=A0A8K0KT20_LADFU|nr:hypothetical protein J437_LFUL000832 [Ladona fulva]
MIATVVRPVQNININDILNQKPVSSNISERKSCGPRPKAASIEIVGVRLGSIAVTHPILAFWDILNEAFWNRLGGGTRNLR